MSVQPQRAQDSDGRRAPVALRVGVIGAGMIGVDHAQRLTHSLAGARVVGIADVDQARAEAAAAILPAAKVHAHGVELIRAADVDAVLVASWGPTHEEYVITAIDAGKPVFCEKPLAPTAEACTRIVEAEVKGGRRLVQVGFMRRYDSGYRAMKAVLDAGTIGAALMVHCVHRNPSVPPYGFTSEMLMTDSAIHEMDLVRWLLGEEVTGAQVLTPRRSSRAGQGLQDPQIMLLETTSGVHIDVEVFVNCTYGYEIGCELVGETGTASLTDFPEIVVRRQGERSTQIAPGWRERFMRAYDIELQEWVRAVVAGKIEGPTAWDGYAASVISDACVAALNTRARVAVSLKEKPQLYV